MVVLWVVVIMTITVIIMKWVVILDTIASLCRRWLLLVSSRTAQSCLQKGTFFHTMID